MRTTMHCSGGSRCADGGGHVVAAGTPEDVAKVKESYTGRYLKDLLGRRNSARRTGAAQDGRRKKEAAE
jgi:excinuclease ABC subunit A